MTGRRLVLRADLLLVMQAALDPKLQPSVDPDAYAECCRRGWINNEAGELTPDGVKLCTKLGLK